MTTTTASFFLDEKHSLANRQLVENSQSYYNPSFIVTPKAKIFGIYSVLPLNLFCYQWDWISCLNEWNLFILNSVHMCSHTRVVSSIRRSSFTHIDITLLINSPIIPFISGIIHQKFYHTMLFASISRYRKNSVHQVFIYRLQPNHVVWFSFTKPFHFIRILYISSIVPHPLANKSSIL